MTTNSIHKITKITSAATITNTTFDTVFACELLLKSSLTCKFVTLSLSVIILSASSATLSAYLLRLVFVSSIAPIESVAAISIISSSFFSYSL